MIGTHNPTANPAMIPSRVGRDSWISGGDSSSPAMPGVDLSLGRATTVLVGAFNAAARSDCVSGVSRRQPYWHPAAQTIRPGHFPIPANPIVIGSSMARGLPHSMRQPVNERSVTRTSKGVWSDRRKVASASTAWRSPARPPTYNLAIWDTARTPAAVEFCHRAVAFRSGKSGWQKPTRARQRDAVVRYTRSHGAARVSCWASQHAMILGHETALLDALISKLAINEGPPGIEAGTNV